MFRSSIMQYLQLHFKYRAEILTPEQIKAYLLKQNFNKFNLYWFTIKGKPVAVTHLRDMKELGELLEIYYYDDPYLRGAINTISASIACSNSDFMEFTEEEKKTLSDHLRYILVVISDISPCPTCYRKGESIDCDGFCFSHSCTRYCPNFEMLRVHT